MVAITSSFESAYRRLVRAFKRYEDVPRSPDDIATIGDARWQLQLARNTMAAERRDVTLSRRESGLTFRKVDVSEDDLARLQVASISAGFG